eukprot:8263159-Pyramimonas_sp.AAC.1
MPLTVSSNFAPPKRGGKGGASSSAPSGAVFALQPDNVLALLRQAHQDATLGAVTYQPPFCCLNCSGLPPLLPLLQACLSFSYACVKRRMRCVLQSQCCSASVGLNARETPWVWLPCSHSHDPSRSLS